MGFLARLVTLFGLVLLAHAYVYISDPFIATVHQFRSDTICLQRLLRS